MLDQLKKERVDLESKHSKSFTVKLSRRSVEVDFDAY